MLRRSGFLFVMILLLFSLALSACSPSKSPTAAPTAAGQKSGYPAPTSQAAQPAYPAQGSAPAQNNTAYPAPQQGAGSPTTSAAYPAPQAGLAVQVVKADGSTANLAAADFQKLTATQVTVGQADMPGYKLSDVLAAAGVTSFQQVTVTGTGNPVTLTQAQVTPDVILSTVDPNGLQLAGSSLSTDQMIKGVTKIQVK